MILILSLELFCGRQGNVPLMEMKRSCWVCLAGCKGRSLKPSDPFSLGTFCHQMSNRSIDFSITSSPNLVLHTEPVAAQ